MPFTSERRFRYGYLLHLDTPGLAAVLRTQVEHATAQWRDKDVPDLYKLAVDCSFSIKGRFDQDLFAVNRTNGNEDQVFTPDTTKHFEEALLYATEFWNNGGSFYISPSALALEPAAQEMPNLSLHEIGEGVSLANITHYPVRLTKQLLAAYPGRLAYYPLQFRVSPPEAQAVRSVVDPWLSARKQDLDVALEIVRTSHPDGWAFTTPVSRLGTTFPNPEQLKYIGSKQDAETEAVRYWGLCFIVNLKTGVYESRWASR